jgi:hypothetical protein
VFADDSFVHLQDQWDYLSKIRLLSAEDVETILQKNSFKTVRIGTADYTDEDIEKAESSIDYAIKNLEDIYPGETTIFNGAMLSNELPRRKQRGIKKNQDLRRRKRRGI